MSSSNIIVHFVVTSPAFTAGYINFMKLRMTEWEHHFFVITTPYEIKPVNSENFYRYSKVSELSEPRYQKLLAEADKIIISGAWDTFLLLKLSKFVRKTYLQFWGGDFYRYRFNRMPGLMHPIRSLKWFIHRCIHNVFIKNSAGTINLIARDIDEMVKVFPNNTKHFVAQMPNDVIEHHDFDGLVQRPKEGSTCRIIVGNSAATNNNHAEIFEKLRHLKDEDIEIVSPLSYGVKDYGETVAKLGREIFGDKFRPIFDRMAKEKYVEFLATCDAGAFNYNQQAALGNIWLLMRLGRKIYLRENTAMWDDFKSKDACIYSVSELDSAALESLADMPEEGRKANMSLAAERFTGNSAVEEWRKVLND